VTFADNPAAISFSAHVINFNPGQSFRTFTIQTDPMIASQSILLFNSNLATAFFPNIIVSNYTSVPDTTGGHTHFASQYTDGVTEYYTISAVGSPTILESGTGVDLPSSWVDATNASEGNFNIESIGVDTTVDPTSDLILVSFSGPFSIDVSLPSTSEYSVGHELIIKRVGGYVVGNELTVIPFSGETIDGAASVSLNVAYQRIRILNTGAEWIQID
jgi:hypothetical protein